MGSICTTSNHNKVSSTKSQPKPTEANPILLNDVPEESPPHIQKKDPIPLSHFFDIMDKNSNPQPHDIERPLPPKIPQEKTFLSTPIPPSVLKGLNGQPILKIKESGRVVNFLGETLGFFKDHYIYVSPVGVPIGRLDEESKVKDNQGSLLGFFASNGVVFDLYSVVKGKIEPETRAFRDKKFMPIGSAEGEGKRLGMIYYFFFKKK